MGYLDSLGLAGQALSAFDLPNVVVVTRGIGFSIRERTLSISYQLRITMIGSSSLEFQKAALTDPIRFLSRFSKLRIAIQHKSLLLQLK